MSNWVLNYTGSEIPFEVLMFVLQTSCTHKEGSSAWNLLHACRQPAEVCTDGGVTSSLFVCKRRDGEGKCAVGWRVLPTHAIDRPEREREGRAGEAKMKGWEWEKVKTNVHALAWGGARGGGMRSRGWHARPCLRLRTASCAHGRKSDSRSCTHSTLHSQIWRVKLSDFLSNDLLPPPELKTWSNKKCAFQCVVVIMENIHIYIRKL